MGKFIPPAAATAIGPRPRGRPLVHRDASRQSVREQFDGRAAGERWGQAYILQWATERTTAARSVGTADVGGYCGLPDGDGGEVWYRFVGSRGGRCVYDARTQRRARRDARVLQLRI